MRGCLLVLSLLACSCQAFNYSGTAVTYQPLKGSVNTALLHYKLAFRECGNVTVVDCPLDLCTVNVVSVKKVDENSGEWCQREVIAHVNTANSTNFTLRLDGIQWISVRNNVTEVLAVTRLDPRNRSDTGRPNASPRTTMLPVLRFPSNCYGEARLPTFDPDGDLVKCTFENYHNLSSFFDVSYHCHMRFTPVINNISVVGSYAVQLLMADLVRKDVNLTDAAGNRTLLPQSEMIGRVPIQFVLRVDPPVESCNSGTYLPYFQHPTPEDGNHLYAHVNKTLEINIHAKATESEIREVLFSGPAGVQKTKEGDGHFVLKWTPTQDDAGLRYPICFVVQAFLNEQVELHSPMRCVTVAVNHNLFGLDARFLIRSHNAYLELQKTGLPELKELLVARGLPPDITLKVTAFHENLVETTTDDPNASPANVLLPSASGGGPGQISASLNPSASNIFLTPASGGVLAQIPDAVNASSSNLSGST
ncbi:uncharacterized protein LOC133472729 [Phyllopteryx taeniolatus]|uniref:uncharacterized protein LOC133472729 n=1 Tax=Phyllopteryx taeniolatus TaxID=161469 RepID=UPI002AD4DD72|nr:uncharacterized protein LOC133472729 [Phyllopteryx taeniolatus]